MRAKKWIFIFFIMIVIIAVPIASINYYIDPLLNFNNKNKYNNIYDGFNERQQKTNYIYNHANNYEGILLGSSRSTFINQNDFQGMNIFNYALNSMYPYEYKGYIDFFKHNKKEAIKYIIIGADFYGTNIPDDVQFKDPSHYIATTNNNFYKYKMLLSIDNFIKSGKTIKMNLFNKPFQFYNREMVKTYTKIGIDKSIKRYKKNIIKHTYQFTNQRYQWNNSYLNNLKIIKNENPNTKFLVFTSPISADLYKSIILNTNKFNEYSRWIKGLIDVFDEIYCFMDINSITKNLQNYPDDDHYYPPIGKIVATKISTKNFNDEPKDFGYIVNKKNVNEFLSLQLKKINAYQYSEYYPHIKMKEQLSK